MSPADATPPPDYQLQDHNEQDWETSVLAARLQDVTIGTATSHDAVSDNYQPAISTAASPFKSRERY